MKFKVGTMRVEAFEANGVAYLEDTKNIILKMANRIRDLQAIINKNAASEKTAMNKNEFIGKRTDIISKMLDNPDSHGIYPATVAFAELDDLFDKLTESYLTDSQRGSSWAQINRDDGVVQP